MASLHLGDLKRHVDRFHTRILKEIDASYCQLHKQFKMQNQSCQQVSYEIEKEYKKMFEWISETQEAMMSCYVLNQLVILHNSYVEFMVDVHLTKSTKKAIDGLLSCYGISST
ncbi:hypothetical protein UlMin_024675 [Ulmus minor]